MFEISLHDNYLEVEVSGRLTHNDYVDHLIPTLEKSIAIDKQVNLLILAIDFHGWELRAMWDDFKAATKHKKDFKRVAIVGDHAWEGFLSNFFSLFVEAEVKYFGLQNRQDAEKWVNDV